MSFAVLLSVLGSFATTKSCVCLLPDEIRNGCHPDLSQTVQNFVQRSTCSQVRGFWHRCPTSALPRYLRRPAPAVGSRPPLRAHRHLPSLGAWRCIFTRRTRASGSDGVSVASAENQKLMTIRRSKNFGGRAILILTRSLCGVARTPTPSAGRRTHRQFSTYLNCRAAQT
jgi:hypothetical protein